MTLQVLHEETSVSFIFTRNTAEEIDCNHGYWLISSMYKRDVVNSPVLHLFDFNWFLKRI